MFCCSDDSTHHPGCTWRSGLSEPTLRYYEQVRLIGPIERDPSSRHRRYREADLNTLQALACLRAMGVGIEDMRTYQANRLRGREGAGEQRDLLLRHAERVVVEIETLRTHLDYLRAKQRCGTPGTATMRARRPTRNSDCMGWCHAWKRWCCDESPTFILRAKLATQGGFLDA